MKTMMMMKLMIIIFKKKKLSKNEQNLYFLFLNLNYLLCNNKCDLDNICIMKKEYLHCLS